MHTTVTQAPAFPSPRSHDPFETGLRHGWMTGEHVSNRQVAAQYPDWSIGPPAFTLADEFKAIGGDCTNCAVRDANCCVLAECPFLPICPAFNTEDFPGFTDAQIIAGLTVPAAVLTEAEIEQAAKVCPVFRYNMTGAR